MSEAAIAARSEHGRRLVRDYLSRPDIIARAHAPEAKAARIKSYLERRMGWCPAEMRAAYDHLIYVKKIPSAEARRIIETEIEGTVEHGRREVANRLLAQKLRHEREQAERF